VASRNTGSKLKAAMGAILGQAATPLEQAIADHRHIFIASIGFGASMSVLALTTSLYMLQVYDRVLPSRSVETLVLLTLIASAALAVFAYLDAVRLRLLARAGVLIAQKLSGNVFRAMIATAAHRGGSDIRNGLRDVETLKSFIGSATLAALMDIPFGVVFLGMLYFLHPIYLVIVLAFGAVLIVTALVGRRLTDPVLTRSMALLTRSQDISEDGLRNADVLEGMGMSGNYLDRWQKGWLEGQGLGLSSSDWDTRLSSVSKAIRLLLQIVLLGAGAVLILNFNATGGIMIAASIIGARAIAPIEGMITAWKSIVSVRLAWDRLDFLLLDAPKRSEGMQLPAPEGKLSAVRAGYATPRRGILSNVSFDLDAGESMGVIGPSASGKSTLARLLIGAWPCSAGKVRLDGADIYSWPRQELGTFIGYLPQGVELFAGTVRENIARMADGDPAEVVRAAKLANAHDMILALPEGYDTEVGAGGSRLSAGQSQRIGLARALYGNPKLVVLDEPNSNLDRIGEDALGAALTELRRMKVTTIVIAHRPAIVAGMDKLLVLGNGTVEAFGPREEVMKNYIRPVPVREPTVESRMRGQRDA
jgi:ATP-binding cassette subfamily C protein/ATP-binding cassette subfamily C protein EexD